MANKDWRQDMDCAYNRVKESTIENSLDSYGAKRPIGKE